MLKSHSIQNLCLGCQGKFVVYNCSAPIYAIVLEKLNAVLDWRDFAGPTNSEMAKKIAPSR